VNNKNNWEVVPTQAVFAPATTDTCACAPQRTLILLARMAENPLCLFRTTCRSTGRRVRRHPRGIELPSLVIHMQVVRVEQARPHQPDEIGNGQGLALEHDQAIGAQFLQRSVDVNLGEPGGVGKVALGQREVTAVTLGQAGKT
jgi:hypothetical protein